MERTIKVTGKGKLSIKPDTIRLIMTVEGLEKEYEDAVRISAAMTEDIKKLFVKRGFSKDDLKTLYFNVSTEFESYQAKDKSWKKRFEGYKFVHKMKIEFPSDNKSLGGILYALSHSTIRPEFRFEYTVAEPEKYKNALLGNAVTDSKQKAEVLVSAAGIKLGNIVTIDYSWGEIDFITRPMNDIMLEEYCVGGACPDDLSYDIDINPDDIDVSDTVTVIWNLE